MKGIVNITKNTTKIATSKKILKTLLLTNFAATTESTMARRSIKMYAITKKGNFPILNYTFKLCFLIREQPV